MSVIDEVFIFVAGLIVALVASATSISDTWASKIGILSKAKTRNVVNFTIVPKGSSGTISGLATIAS